MARTEKEENARPAIKETVENWDDYDVVFIGCPVWWWTTPMIIHTFCESYDFKGKTVIPFCTYAATYRDETLAEIVNSTPGAAQNAEVWGNRFDAFLTRVMAGESSGVSQVENNQSFDGVTEHIYDLNGRRIASAEKAGHDVYIVRNAKGSIKRMRI